MTTDPIRPIDGSVYAYQVSPDEALVYATIAGPDAAPMIVMFDLADLDALKRARRELKATVPRSASGDQPPGGCPPRPTPAVSRGIGKHPPRQFFQPTRTERHDKP